jgi:hypothetical protein
MAHGIEQLMRPWHRAPGAFRMSVLIHSRQPRSFHHSVSPTSLQENLTAISYIYPACIYLVAKNVLELVRFWSVRQVEPSASRKRFE